jgi:aspartate/methionine/tyrosine aminotransferase
VLAFLAVLNSRDTLLQPSSGHPCYGQILKVLGVRPVPLETDAAARWIPVAGDLDRHAF